MTLRPIQASFYLPGSMSGTREVLRRQVPCRDDALDGAGAQCALIPIRQRRERLQECRRVYAAPPRAIKGGWTWRGFDCRVFDG